MHVKWFCSHGVWALNFMWKPKLETKLGMLKFFTFCHAYPSALLLPSLMHLCLFWLVVSKSLILWGSFYKYMYNLLKDVCLNTNIESIFILNLYLSSTERDQISRGVIFLLFNLQVKKFDPSLSLKNLGLRLTNAGFNFF